MTIGKKLYVGFGSILGILVLLSLVSFTASQREHSARNTAAATLQSIQTIEKIRFQVMENGLDLRNYLLSGDPREESAEAAGVKALATILREAQNKSSDDRLREAYSAIESNQQSWEDDFSKPLIAKRHQVDAGQTTVSDLQIVYLQRSANNWVEKSVKEMDDAERGIQKALEESNASANSSATYSTMALTLGTIIGVFLGMIVAYRTSLSITQPLTALIVVTREIAETGDLDQKIEMHRDDDIGSLADHYRNRMLHLKEMASVSAAIAEGRLNVTVRPRSSRDTMANAFLQMIRGLRDLAMKVRDSATGVAA